MSHVRDIASLFGPDGERLQARFWAQVALSAEGCWLWSGAIGTTGYGTFYLGGYPEKAHRISYLLNFGAIPDRMHVLHRCDNPPCVRPDHLWLGTQADNMADMARKGRRRGHLRPACKWGHPWTPENTGRQSSGARRWRACERVQSRARRGRAA